MSNNVNLINAQKAKRDEFFTPREAVENELKYYPDCFKGKIVYCNCDDPHVSEFFKYFLTNFKRLGLKALYCTCYEGSKASQLRLNQSDEEYQGKPYKAIIVEDDINTIIDEYGELTRETAERYINEYDKIETLKGNGSFDSPECLELLKEADVVVTNPPFSLFRAFVKLLVGEKKKFLLIGNMNAVTYKDIFPLIKNNELWYGFTRPKNFVTQYGENTRNKVSSTRWFSSIGNKGTAEDIVLTKKYNPDKYPKYDNYDAINVDRVADIPCDYVESWGLHQEEYNVLDKSLWQTVRRGQINGEEVIYVIPAKNTELRQTLHDHSEGYKEKIETELANAIYCNGEIGVPITVVDKLNDEQFKIVGADFDLAQPVELDNGKTGTGRFYVQKGLDNHTVIGNNPAKEPRSQGAKEPRSQGAKEPRSQGANVFTVELSFARYCNGVTGVPITFLDKWSPEQFKLFGATESEGTGFSNGLWYSNSKVAQPLIRNNRKYKRLFIQKIL